MSRIEILWFNYQSVDHKKLPTWRIDSKLSGTEIKANGRQSQAAQLLEWELLGNVQVSPQLKAAVEEMC